ncbi:hypothetical protein JCM12856_21500 [Spirochaeta dissipatitropha]
MWSDISQINTAGGGYCNYEYNYNSEYFVFLHTISLTSGYQLWKKGNGLMDWFFPALKVPEKLYCTNQAQAN